MDKGTVGGLLGGAFLITGSILYGGSLLAFVSVPSILIVIGGTAAALCIGFPLHQVSAGLKAGRHALSARSFDADATVKLLASLASRARSEGLLSLETAADETDDKFLESGLRLMADGHDADTVETVLFSEIEKMEERHRQAANVFDAMGTYGPAMGMIGTLIGLVQMLQNMQDPTTIGPAMAVALLTTFYGSLIANLVGIPIANKLRVRSAEEVQHRELVVTGLQSILAGDNPRFLVERLHATMAPTQRQAEAA